MNRYRIACSAVRLTPFVLFATLLGWICWSIPPAREAILWIAGLVFGVFAFIVVGILWCELGDRLDRKAMDYGRRNRVS